MTNIFITVHPKVSYFFFSLEKILEPLTHSFGRMAVFFFPAVFFFSRTHSLLLATSGIFFSKVYFFFPAFPNFDFSYDFTWRRSDGAVLRENLLTPLTHPFICKLVYFWRIFLKILAKLRNNFVFSNEIYSFFI